MEMGFKMFLLMRCVFVSSFTFTQTSYNTQLVIFETGLEAGCAGLDHSTELLVKSSFQSDRSGSVSPFISN